MRRVQTNRTGQATQKFQTEWLFEPKFSDWLEECNKPEYFFCKVCQKAYLLSNPATKVDLMIHSNSQEHRQKKQMYVQQLDDLDPNYVIEIEVLEEDEQKLSDDFTTSEIHHEQGKSGDELVSFDMPIDGFIVKEVKEGDLVSLDNDGTNQVIESVETYSENEEEADDDDEPIPVYTMEIGAKFLAEWKNDPDLSPWLVEKENNAGYCKYCKCYLRISGGKKALMKHFKTVKHARNNPFILEEVEEETPEVTPIEEFISNDDANTERKRVAKFASSWKVDPELKDWVVEKRGLAFCTVCSVYLRVVSGRKNLLRHKQSQKHISNLENMVKAMCRVCLEEFDLKFMPSIWDRDRFTEMRIFQKIMQCTGITIKIEDKNTDKICLACADKLNDSFNFMKACEQSESYFNSLSESNDEDEPEQPERDKQKRNTIHKEPIMIYDTPPPVPMHILSDEIKVEDSNLSTPMVAYEEDIIMEEPNSQNEEFVEEVSMIEENLDEEFEEPDLRSNKIISRNVNNQMSNAARTMKSYSEVAKVYRNVAPKEEVHICDICGNSYDDRVKLQNHRRNHNEEKPHECEVCQKRFRYASKLQLHIRTHTGEKPFKCGYCDRRFGDHTSRKRHERIHRNERPFKCEFCGKTFTYSHTLKVHRIIHTGEKKFHCIPCSKSFPQKHKLKEHEQTIVHRNTISVWEQTVEENKVDLADIEENVEYTIEPDNIMNVKVEGSTIFLTK